MYVVFSSVVASVANDFVMHFSSDFDFKGMLTKISADTGVRVKCLESTRGTRYKLQGAWCDMREAHRLLDAAATMHRIPPTSADALLSHSQPLQTDKSHNMPVQVQPSMSRGDAGKMKCREEISSLPASVTGSSGNNAVTPNDSVKELERIAQPMGIGKTCTTSITAALVEHTGQRNEVIPMDLSDKTEDEKGSDPGSSEPYVSNGSSTLKRKHIANNTIRSKEARKQPGRPSKVAGKNQDRGISQRSSPLCHRYSLLSKYQDQRYRVSKTNRKSRTGTPCVSDSSDVLATQKQSQSEDDEHSKTKYVCQGCKCVSPSTKPKLTDDKIKVQRKDSPISCNLCGKIYNQMYMIRHQSSHKDPQHCCDVCGKMFKIQKALINHRKTHEVGYSRPVFPCKVCSKTFCSQYIVDCHVKSVHMGQTKSYLCSYCGKKFTTKHSLQEHVNAHSGIKPHVCEICGKGFSYDSALRDHKYTHDEVKQFRCEQCHKTFCQRSGLKMHMRIHKNAKQFECQQCGRQFTQKQALQRHERVHKGVKPFTCRLCSHSFTDASIIRRHLTLVHKIHKNAKTWREDIVCSIKPDLQYHVALRDSISIPDSECVLTDGQQREPEKSAEVCVERQQGEPERSEEVYADRQQKELRNMSNPTVTLSPGMQINTAKSAQPENLAFAGENTMSMFTLPEAETTTDNMRRSQETVHFDKGLNSSSFGEVHHSMNKTFCAMYQSQVSSENYRTLNEYPAVTNILNVSTSLCGSVNHPVFIHRKQFSCSSDNRPVYANVSQASPVNDNLAHIANSSYPCYKEQCAFTHGINLPNCPISSFSVQTDKPTDNNDHGSNNSDYCNNSSNTDNPVPRKAFSAPDGQAMFF